MVRNYGTPPEFDLVIVGGGIVGLTLAGLVAQATSLRVAIIDPNTPDPTIAAEQGIQRVSALNLASEALLQRLGVWHTLAMSAAPYRQLLVWQSVGCGQLAISSRTFNLPQLGHIVDNRQLRQALWQQSQQQPGITLLAPERVQAVVWQESLACLTLERGAVLTTRLVIAADGRDSWVRQQADIPVTFYDYPQQALVATIKTAQPHQATAYQWFHEDAVLALLPLADPHHCSIVWSLPSWMATALVTDSPARFNAQLSAASDRRLGDCQLVGARHCFPVSARYAQQFAGHRVALVGDAAHTLHPLAGQGLNLGLADVALLATELQRRQATGQAVGSYRSLRRFERQRKYEAAKLLAVTHGLQQLFAGQHPLKRWLRGTGLQVVDRLTPLKAYLVRQASGILGDSEVELD
jgi:2-octaprenylphenol hydroxylase